MNIKVTKNTIQFEPITVSVEFQITSYDELKEFVKFNEDEGDVCQYNGDKSYVLTEIIETICTSVAKGL